MSDNNPQSVNNSLKKCLIFPNIKETPSKQHSVVKNFNFNQKYLIISVRFFSAFFREFLLNQPPPLCCWMGEVLRRWLSRALQEKFLLLKKFRRFSDKSWVEKKMSLVHKVDTLYFHGHFDSCIYIARNCVGITWTL